MTTLQEFNDLPRSEQINVINSIRDTDADRALLAELVNQYTDVLVRATQIEAEIITINQRNWAGAQSTRDDNTRVSELLSHRESLEHTDGLAIARLVEKKAEQMNEIDRIKNKYLDENATFGAVTGEPVAGERVRTPRGYQAAGTGAAAAAAAAPTDANDTFAGAASPGEANVSPPQEQTYTVQLLREKYKELASLPTPNTLNEIFGAEDSPKPIDEVINNLRQHANPSSENAPFRTLSHFDIPLEGPALKSEGAFKP